MHLKRNKAPTRWPIKRKGTKFVVRTKGDINKGIPLLIVLREALSLVKNRKEAKKILNKGDVLVNQKPIKNEQYALLSFDILTIKPEDKNYRLIFSKKGKFKLKEISKGESQSKITKIMDKKILKKGKIQLNLNDGRNILSEKGKEKIGDSLLINFKTKKIEKIIPLKEGSQVIVFNGKHTGEIGKIKSIDEEKNIAELKLEDKTIDIDLENLMALN